MLFDDAAIIEFLGIGKSTKSRLVPHPEIQPYLDEIARRRCERKAIRSLCQEIKYRLTLIIMAAGSTKRAAKLLNVNIKSLTNWYHGTQAPHRKQWLKIDWAYALALDAIRLKFLRGTSKFNRIGRGLKWRPWSKVGKRGHVRDFRRRPQLKVPVLWENYEAKTNSGNSGETTTCDVKANPLPDQDAAGGQMPTVRTEPAGEK